MYKKTEQTVDYIVKLVPWCLLGFVMVIERIVSHLAEWVAMCLLVLMTLVVCYAVFTRRFLEFTPSWAEEFALLSMVWFGFLSIAMGVREDGHIGVTILDSLLPKTVIYFLNYLKWLAVGGFAAFMFTEGLGMTKIGLRNKFPGLGITSGWLYVVVSIAGGAMVLHCFMKIVGLIHSGLPTKQKENENV